MTAVLSFLVSPLGRALALGLAIVAAALWLYQSGRSDQAALDHAKGIEDVLETVREANRARERSRLDERAYPGGVPDDPFRRD